MHLGRERRVSGLIRTRFLRNFPLAVEDVKVGVDAKSIPNGRREV
jgi:hypothetical protein